MSVSDFPGWDRLRHGGLLLDGQRLVKLLDPKPVPLDDYTESRLRRQAEVVLGGSGSVSDFVAFVLEDICGFGVASGIWLRGSAVPASWGRRPLTGETVKPRYLWKGPHSALLPVFLDENKRLGIGKSRRTVSRVLGWLRSGDEHLALVTNGRQWRLIFAGLDYDAWCEWDLDLWFEGGDLSPQVTALRTLLQPALWMPTDQDVAPPLLQAIRDTRKGQAELSSVLGERVRKAVEVLIQSHGEVLQEQCAEVDPADIYRAACRVVMRLVVILFAESRDLLPRDNILYHESYGLDGLLERLEKIAVRHRQAMADNFSAWPHILALFRLIREGSHHPELPVPAYGGELFAPGKPDVTDGLSRAIAVFENACLKRELLPDRDVHEMLVLLTRTRIRIRQGRNAIWAAAPVDFSDLSTEYIGILYEGLLDYELKTAPPDDPVVFLSVGAQPALPLSRLEAMDDKAIKALFENLKKEKDDNIPDDETPDGDDDEDEDKDGELLDEEFESIPTSSQTDSRHASRNRAQAWALNAVRVAGLVRKPRGKETPERRLAFEGQLADKASKLVARIVLPGEQYLVRWGGTRKGSGSFYTRPGLAVPTVQRTLRPLAYDPPAGVDGVPDRDALPTAWIPKPPEEILSLQVCDPACGSGTFPLASLRFLTDALYISLQHHRRILPDGELSLIRLLRLNGDEWGGDVEYPGEELIPCPPDHENFELRLKAVLRRHVVERCIYAVDIDPLAVELCRLSLWIETMDWTLPFGFLDHKIKCGNSLVGAWFDQFQHYPVMAWKNREGGDKNHSNGEHFEKNARTAAIKAFVKDELTPDLQRFLQGSTLFEQDLLERAATAHDAALGVLSQMHALPVQDAAERARIYREELLESDAYSSLKMAMDLWCACWFWPLEEIDCAPLPSTFTKPPDETQTVAERVAAEMRFFHWELEFPDVFRETGDGFDAMLGNPPWDIAKPASLEFFSNIDPLYRSYGRQEALRRQNDYFRSDKVTERDWLDYNARFRAQSNFMSLSARPFGQPGKDVKSQHRFTIVRGGRNERLHTRWGDARAHSHGYADLLHSFRYQGSADLNLYKLFLEATHALLRQGGRLGFIVPSGLYSDHGTGSLRDLFLNHCRWEWLFGIENRGKIFPIDSRFKFNPVIVEKGGATEVIHTAFMRRNLEDWERAEEIVTPYTREQIERFSPKSRAILGIQSRRDLEILEKIYANAVLLGDDGPGGWGICYTTEFHMTNDSRFFPPRSQWEERGYRPDEYSRWLLGDWRPIEELWEELGIDLTCLEAAGIALEDWLFDATASSERREAEARFVHGHLLKPGDVARTDWRLRCAQLPYDRLPIPRTGIPVGVLLSREGDVWIWESEIEDVALPLYQGLMFYNRLPNVAQHIRGSGKRAKWNKEIMSFAPIQPQFLISREEYYANDKVQLYGTKIGIRSLSNATNERTVVTGVISDLPAGHSVNYLTPMKSEFRQLFFIVSSSLIFDWQARMRIAGTNMTFHFLEEMGLPQRPSQLIGLFCDSIEGLGLAITPQTATRLEWNAEILPLSPTERIRCSAIVDALIALVFGLESRDLVHIFEGCDFSEPSGKATGFWRIDKDKPPELRHTVLTQIAFHDLQTKIEAADGDRDKGIAAFLAQNHGEGWMLPETLRLADYGLGHDERAKHPQPVASRLGPRFYDWQLVQTAEESRRELHLHARNLLGKVEYDRRFSSITYEDVSEDLLPIAAEPKVPYDSKGGSSQKSLFGSE